MAKATTPRGKLDGIASFPSQAWRLQHSARLLLQNYTVYEKLTLAALRAAGFEGLKHLHLNVIRHVDLDGTRMAELARRMHVTKAATTALIAQCERDGYVTVEVDREDARARLVRFSKKGQRLMARFKNIVTAVEAEIEFILGAQGYRDFREALLLLRDKLSVAPVPSTHTSQVTAAKTRQPVSQTVEVRIQPPRLRAGMQGKS